MSLEQIKKRLNSFLASDTPEVIAIKGPWGIGKTFAWNRILKDAKKRGGIKLGKYAYVSLFGIDSIKDIKLSIFENSVGGGLIGESPTITTLESNAISTIGSYGRKCLSHVFGTGFFKQYVYDYPSAAFLSVNKCIVCIDDLERRGSPLRDRDVYGLVSLLKEQRECKVVLIFNETELKECEYEKFREKILDSEILFDPTTAELAEIAYPSSGDIYDYLKEAAIDLGVKNIRILKIAEKFVRDIESLLSHCKKSVLRNIVRKILLYVQCNYKSDDSYPDLEFALNMNHRAARFLDKDGVDDKYNEWNRLLSRYEFGGLGDLDLALASFVSKGWVDEFEMKRHASSIDRYEEINSRMESYQNAWNAYHNSFDNNTREIVNAMFHGCADNIDIISVDQLGQGISLLRQLGEEEKADFLIDTYIKSQRSKIEGFNPGDSFFRRELDGKFLAAIQDVRSSRLDERSLEDVLEKIVNDKGFGESEKEYLLRLSEDEYYSFFKSYSGEKLYFYVKACLMYKGFVDAPDEGGPTGSKIENALKRIAKESKINRLRVQGLGVKLDE
ncbi:hypothetical protein dsat_1662 [Alkalidesulfovibrio alkalitolerans DSM 16529]|uniref:KAP P-loop domain protein n=1 Tax=Alkalidesulfovibrio alkalitolerans DSM 16529 TaxID=1121439 RepID=S7UQ11_9BACT|nr:P-loop NTPase fold protein [Alkalidesulfovibrio alkalitolerans]EPR36134.1 hypothetical protein dsat_1662 [Alkalidesulfovibrio alkalitolerans DSM 16529]